MKYKTNEEMEASAQRMLINSRGEIESLKMDLMDNLRLRKDLRVKYLDIFYNVIDEQYELIGVFTIHGRMFWVEKSGPSIMGDAGKQIIDEFLRDVNDWVDCCAVPDRWRKSPEKPLGASPDDGHLYAENPGSIRGIHIQANDTDVAPPPIMTIDEALQEVRRDARRWNINLNTPNEQVTMAPTPPGTMAGREQGEPTGSITQTRGNRTARERDQYAAIRRTIALNNL